MSGLPCLFFPPLLKWRSEIYHPASTLHIELSLTFGFINRTLSLLRSPRIRIQSFSQELHFHAYVMGRQGSQKVTPYKKCVSS